MHAGLEGPLDPPAQHAPEWSREEVPVTVTVPLLSPILYNKQTFLN